MGTAGATAPPESFLVTKTADTADGSCDSDCSLREAVIAANAAPGHQTIHVGGGVYALTMPGTGEDSSASGDLDITSDVSIIALFGTAEISGSGQFRVLDALAGANLTVSNVWITNGLEESGSAGGGLRVEATASVNLSDCEVGANSSAGLTGGGITSDGALTIERCLITGNSTGAGSGAGGGIATRGGGPLVIRNSTISGNSSAFAGGGILADGFGTTELYNVTVTDNTAGTHGGGLEKSGGEFSLRNTIVAGNNAAQDAPDCDGAYESLGHNLIGNTDSCVLAGDTSTNITGVNPMLAPSGDNGGPTRTHALLPGSPAIDAGDDANCPPVDQRAFGRPADGDGDTQAHCDIGAFERNAIARQIPFGDVRCDGQVDATDALGDLRYVAGLPHITQDEPCLDIGTSVPPARIGDVQCDGDVDAVDALGILRFVAGLPPITQEPNCPAIGSLIVA
jgi:CSLREA domain-containing protein